MKRYPQYLAVARHVQSVANAALAEYQARDEASEARYYYDVTGSDPKIGVTEFGREQGKILGLQLRKLFPAESPIRKIFVGRFRRLDESADLIVEQLGYEPERVTDVRVGKRSYGKFWNLTYEGIEALYPEEHTKFHELGPLAYRPPGGENYFDVFQRVDGFFADAVEHAEGNLLIVTSLVVALSIQRKFEGLADEEVVSRYENEAIANGQLLLYVRQSAESPWQPVPSEPANS